MVVTIGNENSRLAVRCDANWIKLFCENTGVFKPEFAGRAEHHYCTGMAVSHAEITVPVLSEMFHVSAWEKRLPSIDPLNILYFCVGRVARYFRLFLCITVHKYQKVTIRSVTDIEGVPSIHSDELLYSSIPWNIQCAIL